MPTLYLSLRDAAATAERDTLSRAIDAAPSATDADYAAMREMTARWAAMPTTVQAPCASCGRPHDALWTIRRRMLAPFGPWPVARIHVRDAGGRYARAVVIDPSLPTTVDMLPADAVPVPPDVAAALWHDDSGSHVFGGPDVCAMLRAAVADANRR